MDIRELLKNRNNKSSYNLGLNKQDDIRDNLNRRFVENIAANTYDLSQYSDELESFKKYNVAINPFDSYEDLQKARAANQSGLEQFGNFLVQSVAGEVFLGGLEGFGNIFDGLMNIVTDGGYEGSAYTQTMYDARQNLKKNFEIYRENPNASWDTGDFGWWMDSAVSIATTASLLIPAAGWARGLSYIGKLSGLSKLGRATSRFAARGLARLPGKGKAIAGDFGAMRTAAARAGRIDKTIRGSTGIITQAALSRTGESFMEARDIYNDIYANAKENIEGMLQYDKENGTNEFAKFIANNPEFRGMSIDDIAKQIAKKSADKTFYNDLWMIAMDVPQFKALGSIWGKGAKRASTVSERIAVANQKKLLAGATNEQLIKNNIVNRTKESIKYALKNPKDSFLALEFGEGFEEMYQGIQSEKGMEVAAKYFDPSLSTRTLGSYLSDPSIWEQGFWGVLGGVGFNKIGKGLQKGSHKIQGLWNKSHMTAEDYELWNRSADKIALEQLNGVTDNTKKFIEEMKQVNDGINPYNFVIDESTGQYLIKDGNLVNETIDENQKDLLKEHAIKTFVDNAALDAVDNGTIDLMKQIVGSSEFDKFIADNGVRLSSADKALSKQVVARMDEVAGLYYTALNDVNSLTEDSNPYVTKNAARSIVRNKLISQDYDAQLGNINTRIDEANDTGANFSPFEEKVLFDSIQDTLNRLKIQRTNLQAQYDKEEISKSAFELHNKEIERSERELVSLAAKTTTQGAFMEIKDAIQDFNYNTQEVLDQLDNFFKTYNDSINNKQSGIAKPTDTIEQLIKQKAAVSIRKAFTNSKIPVTKKDYEDLYDEFSYSMDAMMIKKTNDAIDRIKNYLRNAKDFNKALSDIMKEDTGDKNIDEALSFIKYGYYTQDATNGRLRGQTASNLQLATVIDEISKERQTAEERNKEAKEQGVELPSNEELDSGSPSTGNKTQTGPAVPSGTTNANNAVVTENPVENTVSDEIPNTGVQTAPDEEIITDKSIPDVENPLTINMQQKELEEQAQIAAGYETDSLKASLDASKYVMHIGFKETGRFNNITKALESGDTSKYEEFIKEVTDFLISRGYSKNLAEVTAKTAFTNTVASFAAMDNKNVFAKLAQQLAIGFGEKGAKQYSITELIDGKGIDEIVEEFLNEYSRLVDNDNIDGFHIINMESLFEYILSNKDIDIQTAAYIYNNIGKFISTHDGSKFKFTGFNPSREYSAKQFFDRINERKARTIAAKGNVHISPIESDQRSTDYTNALIAAANGAPTYVKIEGTSRKDGNVELDENGKPLNTHIAVYVDIKKGKRVVPVKIGILRTVKADSDLTNLSPISHYSGFSNAIRVNNNGSISLDCDFLFYALINDRNKDKNVNQLFRDLVNYYITTQDIKDRLNSRVITPQQAQKEFAEAMPLDTARRILSNPLVTRLLQSERYKFYKKEKLDEVSMASRLTKSICSILFYKYEGDPLNSTSNDMAIDTMSMTQRYEEWKAKVYDNYTHTYELQNGLKDNDSKVSINVNVGYSTQLNIVSDKEKYPNIEDAGFDVDKNSPNHTPLVIVNPEGHLVDEDGNDYGAADIRIAAYSMGFLVHNKDNVKYVAYFNSAQELNGSPIYAAVQNELYYLVKKQLYNTVEDTHDANFDEIFNKLIELFSPKGMFIFNDFNTVILADRLKSFATIAAKDKNGNKKNLITFYRKNIDNVTNSNAIGLYIPRLGKQIAITDIKDTKVKNVGVVTKQEIRAALNSAFKEMLSSVKLNKSLNVMRNRGINGTQSRYFRRENGKFIVNLGGNDYTYENYGDFMLKNRAFNTNVDGSSGSFVIGVLDENEISINTRIRDTTQDVNPENTFVSDLLFNDKNVKRKTVDTKDILEAAGVLQDKIDVLLGTNSGMPIVTKRVTGDTDDDSDVNAYYNPDDNKVYITQKGASAMNSNPTNTIRLILHENLHRLFHNKKSYTDAERERIIEELKEVYDYTVQQLKRDRASGKISEALYNSISDVLNKATVSNDDQVQMEEFLMECLTQPAIANYLNNTDYHSEVDIDGIPQRKKSIFQKIMDILLDLLGINTNRIRNNSILAREYMILSKTDNATDNGMFDKSVKSDNTQSPVEGTPSPNAAPTSTPINKPTSEPTFEKLAKVRQEIDEVRKGFESRIKRSDNFAEDHIYYIDGKPAETSVTQRIHGKQDIGDYGTPASAFGNTGDDAARVFFENKGRLPDNYRVPNTTDDDGENSRQALERDLNKIKDYLDKRFGKGRYGVITEEFPIGGIINVNGVDKTIAGTMDMIVYTADGDIYIFDFKTKRLGENNGKIDDNTLNGYKRQVNIYRQLIVANYPQLAGKVKTGGLIKFITDYPAPDKVEYRKHPNIPNQLQVREDKDSEFVNIQDSYIDYSIPYFFGNEDFEKYHIINVEQEDFVDEIKSLPEVNEQDISNVDVAGSEMIQDEDSDENVDFDSYDFEDTSYMEEDFDTDAETDSRTLKASTNLIEYNDRQDNIYTAEEQEILKNAPRDSKGRLLAPNSEVSNLAKNEKQYAQVRTKAFKRWFGDWTKITFDDNGNLIMPNDISKVVDKNGEPLVVYHYTDEVFNTFDINYFSRTDLGDHGRGFYFTPKSPEQDEGYFREQYGHNVMSVFLNIKNPLYVTPHDNSKYFNRKLRPYKSHKEQLLYEIDVENFRKQDIENKLYGNDEENKKYKNPEYIGTEIETRRLEQVKNKINKLKEELSNLSEDYDENAEYNTIIKELNQYDGVINKDFEIVVPNPNQIKSATDNNGDFSLTDNNIYHAKTDLISPAEIYAPAVANGSTDNAYGIQIVSNMNSYINTFPPQYRGNIEQLLAYDELNYTCQ